MTIRTEVIFFEVIGKLIINKGECVIIIIFFPIFIFAYSFNELVSMIENSYPYKIAENRFLISQKELEVIKSLNYGKMDMNYNVIKLKETPTINLNNIPMQIGDKNSFIGEIKYSYPIFTGYNISYNIKKSTLKTIIESLNIANTKRVLKLNIAELYDNIYKLEQLRDSLIFAKKATALAKKKAYLLYKEDLLNEVELSEIDANYFEIISKIDKTNNQIKTLFFTLSSILNKRIDNIEGLSIPELKNKNIENRVDVKIIKEKLKVSEADIKIAESQFYPKIGLETAFRKEAENFALSENKYKNIDNSYIALNISYNLFGDSAHKKVEIAKLAKLQTALYLKNYINQIETEINKNLEKIKTLKSELKATKKELKARELYYKYIKEKFNEGLADVTDLNEAISKLAMAKSKVEAIKADIFFYTIKANLDGGNYD